MTSVSVIILNYNGWQDTVPCLESVLDSDCDLQAIVVDNGSTDDSLKRILAWVESKKISYSFFNGGAPANAAPSKEYGKSRLVLMETGANLGFAAGNNAGIRYALASGADYVFVLNNDTKIERNAVSEMLKTFKRHPEAGLAGPKILDFDGNYWQYPCLARLDFFILLFSLTFFKRLTSFVKSLKSKIWYLGEEEAEVYAVPGSAMMFSAEALKNIDLFDEKTFLFYEEFIIAEKLRKTLFKTYFVPEAVISHKWNGAVKRLGAWKTIELVKSEKYFINSYLKFNFLEKSALVCIRLFSYLIRIYDGSYRKNFMNFLREL